MTDSNLIAFLNARLAEDESAAKEAARRPLGDQWDDGTHLTAVSRHLIRHDPARVLREVEAKRRILDRYLKLLDERKLHPDDLALDGAVLGMHGTVRTLTAIYSDHPDYDPAWA